MGHVRNGHKDLRGRKQRRLLQVRKEPVHAHDQQCADYRNFAGVRKLAGYLPNV